MHPPGRSPRRGPRLGPRRTGSGGGRAPTGTRASPAPRRPPAAPPPRHRGGTGQGRQRRHRGAGATGRRAAAPAAEVAAPAAAVDQVAPAGPAAGDGPSRDELTLVWADQVLPHLSARAKPVLAAGHWIDTDGGVALAVPNEPHRARSEQHRAELEAALAAHFGRPVPVAFVLEPSTPARPRGSRRARRPAAPDPEPEEAIDPAELVDAGPEHDLAPFERVTQAFPGAELMDEG